MKKSKVYNLSDDEFQQIIQDSYSYAECCRKIGLSINGENGKRQINKRCSELNISTDHFRRFGRATIHRTIPLEKILIENSTYTNNPKLKERLIREELLEYKCAICGNTGEWQGKPLTLQLDHINGNHHDNRLENLRILCPNCHTQTDTYGSRQYRAKSE